MSLYPIWPVRIACIIVIGICIQAMAILMHEALHRNLFRRPTPDRWAAFAFGIPAFFSGTAYKVAHLSHHQHTRTSLDQDEISNLCRSPRQYWFLFYAWFAVGMLLYIFIVPWKALSIASAADRRRIVREYAAMLALYSLVIVIAILVGRVSELFLYWLLPVQVAMLFSNIRGLAEHLCTEKSSVVSRTRTTTSNALVSFLMCNLNYHLEHHLFPGVPWYNLPKAHKVLAATYAKTGAFIQTSYIGYAAQAFRRGPLQTIHGDRALTP
ncbi:MAG: fatty acid desaturase [Proteobacteria bacterium]|nr:fatty acid desaturase [Pseudomonadota bacterium]